MFKSDICNRILSWLLHSQLNIFIISPFICSFIFLQTEHCHDYHNILSDALKPSKNSEHLHDPVNRIITKYGNYSSTRGINKFTKISKSCFGLQHVQKEKIKSLIFKIKKGDTINSYPSEKRTLIIIT